MKTIFIIKFLLVYILVSFSILSCKENDEQINKNPAPLSNVSVKNFPGNSEIHYTVPENEDIILITAKYETDNDGTEILRFDIKDNPSSLVLSKLSAKKRTVELYTVNSQGNASSSVSIEIEPLVSPGVLYLNEIIKELEIKPVVGGIILYFKKNIDKKLIQFNISYKDGESNWIKFGKAIQTSEENKRIIIEDLPFSDFKIFLSNEEDEVSEVRNYSFEPVIEYELEKSNWSNPKLQQDNWQSGPGESWGIKIQNLWDGITDTRENSLLRYENKVLPLPHSFSIDLGENQQMRLSKVKLYNFPLRGYTYRFRHPKIIEIWGSNNPDSDGGWNNWTMLTVYRSVKPSNQPFPYITDADFEYVLAGEEVRIPVEKVDIYRYLRFKTTETWDEKAHTAGDPQAITLNEVTVWGIK